MTGLGAVLAQLKQERRRLVGNLGQLDQAIKALTKLAVTVPKQGGGANRRATHRISAAARKRIAAAQKARWAKFRASKHKAA
jgi:hypothetical protein